MKPVANDQNNVQKKSHNHNHSHDHSHGNENLLTAFILNLSFCIIELVGGLLTNSVAILSDALHDFGDSLSIGLALYLQKISKRKPDSKYTYGYKRFTILSALINSVVLLTGSIIIITESIKRMMNPSQPDAKGMLILAIIGVIVNGVAFLRLSKSKSLNERVVSLHMMEDVLGWVAVLIGSIIMIFVEVPVLDSILSIAISVYIIYNVYNNLRKALRVLLQGKPSEIDEESIKNALLELPNVKCLHDLHIWSMDSEYMVLTVHLVVEDNIQKEEQQALRSAAHDILKSLDIQHSTIEIENNSENCEWCE